MRRILPLLAALLAASNVPGARADDETPGRLTLENGLRVHVRPLPGAKQVCLLVLFDVGEAHDPPGRSGLAHTIEHLYVTAAAGDAPARTADAMMRAYPNAWNAQTGFDHTVVSFLFPRERLEAEVKDAAARMGALRIEASDLERERPRLLQELANMYGDLPNLAVQNVARARIAPRAEGAQKGGVPEQVEAITLEEAEVFWRRHYKPRNAQVVLAGDLDAEEGARLVRAHFAGIEAGQAPPPRRPRPDGKPGLVELTTDRPPQAWSALACRAWRAPPPGHDDYAAYLLLVSRFFLLASQDAKAPQVLFPLLDDPEVLTASAAAGVGEDAAAALGRIDAEVKEVAARELKPWEPARARMTFASLLETQTLGPALLAQNLYGFAFGLARREQLQIDGPALGARLLALTQADLEKAAAWLAPEKSAEVHFRWPAGER
jgi:zinc protease